MKVNKRRGTMLIQKKWENDTVKQKEYTMSTLKILFYEIPEFVTY
jgi:hypothetical protein